MDKEARDAARTVSDKSLPLPGEIANRSELMLRLLPNVERGLRGEGEQAKFYSRLRDDIAGNDFFAEVTDLGLAALATISQDPQHHTDLMAILVGAEFRQALTRDIAIEYMAAAYDQATADGRDTRSVDEPHIREEFRQAINRRTSEILDRAIAIVVGPLIDTGAGKLPTKKRPRINPPTHNLVFPNEPGYRALTHAVTKSGTAWETREQGLVLTTPLTDPTRKNQMAITLAGEIEEGRPDMLEALIGILPSGEDATALKALLALPALFFDHNPNAQYNAVHETTLADLMRYIGFKPKNRSFDPDDQHRLWRSIIFLSRLYIPGVTAHKARGQKVIQGEDAWFSPVIVLQGVQGLALPKAIRYSLGKDIHSYYMGDAEKRTRMLSISPRIMEFHGRRDINPMRLGVYWNSQFRINQQGLRRGREHVGVSYATMLLKSGVPIDKTNPARQFHRVLEWHEELVAKDLIGSYISPTQPPKGSAFSDYAKLLFKVSEHKPEQ